MFAVVISILSTILAKCQMQPQQPTASSIDLVSQYQKSLLQVNSFLENVEQSIHSERQLLHEVPGLPEPAGVVDYDDKQVRWPSMPEISASTSVKTPNATLAAGFIGVSWTTRNYGTMSAGRITPPAPGKPPQSPVNFNEAPGMLDYGFIPNLPHWEPPSPAASLATRQGETVTETTESHSAVWTHPLQITEESTSATYPSTTKNYILFPGLPSVQTTTVNPFLAELEQDMQRERAGYVTVYALKLFEMLAKKPREHVQGIVSPLNHIFNDIENRRLLVSLGEPLYSSVFKLAGFISALPGDLAKSYAAMVFSMLENRNVLLSAEMRSVLNYADTLVDEEQGQRMFRALEQLNKYPAERRGLDVTRELVNSLLEAYLSLGYTQKRQRLVDELNQVVNRQLAAIPARRGLSRNRKHYNRKRHHKHVGRRHRYAHAHPRGRTLEAPQQKQKIKSQSQNKYYRHHNKQNGVNKKRFKIVKGNAGSNSICNKTSTNQSRRLDSKLKHLYYGTEMPLSPEAILKDLPPDAMAASEERKLRVHLYDALFHGNKTLGRSRRVGGYNSFVESSSGTDQEAALKSNIYKYFGYDPDLEVKDLSV